MFSFLLRLLEAMIGFITTTGEVQLSRLVASKHVDRADLMTFLPSITESTHSHDQQKVT